MRPVAVPSSLRGAWSEWLGARPFGLYGTLTSGRRDEKGNWVGKRTHPEAMAKRLRYCVRLMTRELYGRSVLRKGSPIEYVCGIERHVSWNPHCHFLLRVPGVELDDPLQFDLKGWERRFTETGGWADLQRPRCQEDVVGYATKYVVKGGELILSENLSPAVDLTPALPLGRVATEAGADPAVTSGAGTPER